MKGIWCNKLAANILLVFSSDRVTSGALCLSLRLAGLVFGSIGRSALVSRIPCCWAREEPPSKEHHCYFANKPITLDYGDWIHYSVHLVV